MVNISQTLCRERKTDYKFLVYLFINQGEMLHSGDAELVSGIRYIWLPLSTLPGCSSRGQSSTGPSAGKQQAPCWALAGLACPKCQHSAPSGPGGCTGRGLFSIPGTGSLKRDLRVRCRLICDRLGLPIVVLSARNAGGHSPGPRSSFRKQHCGWTGPCGSYYDRKMPLDTLIRQLWSRQGLLLTGPGGYMTCPGPHSEAAR